MECPNFNLARGESAWAAHRETASLLLMMGCGLLLTAAPAVFPCKVEVLRGGGDVLPLRTLKQESGVTECVLMLKLLLLLNLLLLLLQMLRYR